MSRKIILLLLCHITLYTAFAQNLTISVNATQNKRLISPYIYGRNEGFDKSVQFYKDAGLRFARMNGGNNASGYYWPKRLSVHPDWYNNVYVNDWDTLAHKVNANFPNMQGMFAFQLKGLNSVKYCASRIFDMGGKQVENIRRLSNLNEVSIGASLKPGSYIVQVDGVNSSTSFKVVKLN